MDELQDLTVAELRARLKKHSLPTAGKKTELIKRLSVLPQSTPSIDNDSGLADNGAEEEEAPVIKKTRKSKKTSTTKKSKKSKVIEPVEEEEIELAGDAEKTGEEEANDEMNTSDQTYAVVSPSCEKAKDEVDQKEEKEVAKKATPARRPSECRRSIFKKLGLDPTNFTPASGKKRASTAALPSTAKKRKSTVAIDEEPTVTTDTVEEEQDEPIALIAEEEEETVEDEEQEEKEEEEAKSHDDYPLESMDAMEGEITVDDRSILSLASVNSSARRRSSVKTSSTIKEQGGSLEKSSEFWSDDEEVPVEVDQSMLSEMSSKPLSSRRSSINKQRLSLVKKAQLMKETGGSATGNQLPPKAPTSGVRANPAAAKSAPRSAGRMAPGARFAAAHAKFFADQEFIGDTVAKKEERKAALMKGNANTQRLATPKSTAEMRQPLRDQQKGFKFGSSALPKSFQFGSTAVEEIQKVQKRPSAIPAPTSLIVRKKAGEEQKLDAKARSKVMLKKPAVKNPLLLPTIPDDSSFVDRMATPRAVLSSASRTHRGAGGYTPKRGKMETFVDTTKLSDREYQLAMEAGLLPGGSKKNQKTSSMMKEKEKRENEERRNRTRDELLNVKRKLKWN